jgi:hypothetical protein
MVAQMLKGTWCKLYFNSRVSDRKPEMVSVSWPAKSGESDYPCEYPKKYSEYHQEVLSSFRWTEAHI